MKFYKILLLVLFPFFVFGQGHEGGLKGGAGSNGGNIYVAESSSSLTDSILGLIRDNSTIDSLLTYYDARLGTFISVKDRFTIEDFGAISGDGLDDQAAFQLAVNSGMVGELVLKKNGEYNINSTVLLDSVIGLTILGNGAKITFISSVGASNGFLIEPGTKNVEFNNVYLYGLADQVYYGGGVTSLTSNVRPIVTGSPSYEGIDNLRIINCKIENMSTGAKIGWINGVTLERDSFINCVTSVLGENPLNLNVSNCVSIRDSVVDPGGQNHHFYTNDGDKVTIKDSYVRGGDGQSFNIKSSGGLKRDLVTIDNCIFENSESIWLQNCKQVNIVNTRGINSSGFVLSNGTIDNINIDKCSWYDSDSTTHRTFFQSTVSVNPPNVKITDCLTESPITIWSQKTETLNIINSVFKNHTPNTSGTATYVIYQNSVDSCQILIDNCTFYQEYEPGDTRIFRIQNDNNGKTIVNNCTFINKSGVSQTYVAFISGDVSYRKFYANNNKLWGYSNFTWLGANPGTYKVSNIWKMDSDTAPDQEVSLVTSNTNYTGQRFLQFNGTGDTLTIPSRAIISELYGKPVFLWCQTAGATIRTEGSEEINNSTANYVTVGNDLLVMTSDGSEVLIYIPSIVNLWTQNGSDIYYNSGNVGIGEATPVEYIHIKDVASNSNPKIYIEGGDGSNLSSGLYTTGGGSGSQAGFALEWGRGAASQIDNNTTFGSYLTTTQTTNLSLGTNNRGRIQMHWTGDIETFLDDGTTTGKYWDSSTGSLGVGTNLPGETLDIVGNLELNGYHNYNTTFATSGAGVDSGSIFKGTDGALYYKSDAGTVTQIAPN